jgi:hypothetical protein
MDVELCTKELMAHYKEYFEENNREYQDFYVKRGRNKDWLRLGS